MTSEPQERIVTSIKRKAIEHKKDTHFLLNMHALHNTALVRKALPRTFTKPNRKAAHLLFASRIRAANDARRTEKLAKKAEAAEAKRAGKVAAQQSVPAQPHPVRGALASESL